MVEPLRGTNGGEAIIPGRPVSPAEARIKDWCGSDDCTRETRGNTDMRSVGSGVVGHRLSMPAVEISKMPALIRVSSATKHVVCRLVRAHGISRSSSVDANGGAKGLWGYLRLASDEDAPRRCDQRF